MENPTVGIELPTLEPEPWTFNGLATLTFLTVTAFRAPRASVSAPTSANAGAWLIATNNHYPQVSPYRPSTPSRAVNYLAHRHHHHHQRVVQQTNTTTNTAEDYSDAKALVRPAPPARSARMARNPRGNASSLARQAAAHRLHRLSRSARHCPATTRPAPPYVRARLAHRPAPPVPRPSRVQGTSLVL